METKNGSEQTEITEEVSVGKGRELEEEFAKFMKEKLGWNKMRVGVHLLGKSNRKGAAVDIIAERVDERGKKFRKASLITLILTFEFGLVA